MLEGYSRFAPTVDDFDVLGTERKILIPVLRPDGSHVGSTFYVCKVDGIVRRRDGIWLMEHKTAGDTNVGHLWLDSQHSRYLMAAAVVLGTEWGGVRGSLHTVLRKQKPGPRVKAPLFAREEVTRSNDEMLQTMEDMYNRIRDMAMSTLRPERIYPSFGKDCQWCPYNMPCKMRLERRDDKEIIDLSYFVRDDLHPEYEHDDDPMTIEIASAA
jgi:hypothetical protein